MLRTRYQGSLLAPLTCTANMTCKNPFTAVPTKLNSPFMPTLHRNTTIATTGKIAAPITHTLRRVPRDLVLFLLLLLVLLLLLLLCVNVEWSERMYVIYTERTCVSVVWRLLR